MKLQGRIAVVTGASRGIGWEIALGFAAEGADLAVCARDEGRLKRLVDQIEQGGRRAIAVRADVAKEADVQRIVETAAYRLVRLLQQSGVLDEAEVDTLGGCLAERQ